MATLYQLLAAVQAQTEVVTSGLSISQVPIQVQVGTHWPPMRTLQQVVKLNPPGALVSVFDRKVSKDSTRWIPSTSVLTSTPATLSSSPTSQIIPAGSSGVITITGPVSAGDAISLVVSSYRAALGNPGDGTVAFTPSIGEVVSPPPTASAADVATQLAAAVAGDPAGSVQLVQVTASGTTLIVTNTSPASVVVQTYTGNGGSKLTEIARRERDVQVTIWAPSDEILQTVSDPVEDMIAQIETFRGHTGEYTAGLALADGTYARVRMLNDFLIDDAVLSDTYRRDFIFCMDYGVTTQDNLYSVLSMTTAFNTGYQPS